MTCKSYRTLKLSGNIAQKECQNTINFRGRKVRGQGHTVTWHPRLDTTLVDILLSTNDITIKQSSINWGFFARLRKTLLCVRWLQWDWGVMNCTRIIALTAYKARIGRLVCAYAMLTRSLLTRSILIRTRSRQEKKLHNLERTASTNVYNNVLIFVAKPDFRQAFC